MPSHIASRETETVIGIVFLLFAILCAMVKADLLPDQYFQAYRAPSRRLLSLLTHLVIITRPPRPRDKRSLSSTILVFRRNGVCKRNDGKLL